MDRPKPPFDIGPEVTDPVLAIGDSGFTAQITADNQGLGTTVHTQAVNAFTDAMATGFGVVAVIVLIAAAVVARGLGGRHRRAEL